MITLSVQVDGQESIAELFGRLESALDTKAILDQSGAILLDNIRRRYLSQINPEGQRWEVSKASQRRARFGLGGGTLYNTGTLFHSIQLADDGANGRAIKTDVPYAIFANYGTIHMPARVFMDFNPADVEQVMKFINDRITKAIG
jgi:phage gpG-like protein